MARTYRIDRAELRPPQKRADGSVRYDAVLSRVGVFEYRQPDGKVRREYRSAEEVGRADSLASLELTPVTDGHPAKPGLAKKQAVGSVGDSIKFDGRHVTASIVVLDDAVNERITRGDMRELSPGYSIDLVEVPGVSPDGEAYDASQTNIIYEHQALVPRGRQGSTVGVRSDADDGWRADASVCISTWGAATATVVSPTLSQEQLETAVRKAVESESIAVRQDAADRADKLDITVVAGYADNNGRATVTVSSRDLGSADLVAKLKAGLASIDAEVAPATDPTLPAAATTPPRTDRADAAGHMEPVMEELQKKLAAALADLAAANVRADAAEAKVKTESARADKAEGDRDAAKDRADKADKARADAIEAAPGQVRARLQLEAQVLGILGKDFKCDGQDDTALKAAVVAKLTTKELPADKAKNADYVSARFDAAIELAGEAAAAGGALRNALPITGEVRADELDVIRRAAHDEQRNAGRKPLTTTATGSN